VEPVCSRSQLMRVASKPTVFTLSQVIEEASSSEAGSVAEEALLTTAQQLRQEGNRFFSPPTLSAIAQTLCSLRWAL
jgi:hypothetical protein